MTKLDWLPRRSDAALADAAEDLFAKEFSAPPAGVWAAPGRVNLIGEHIDYAGGASIPFALEHNTAVAVAPRTDGQLRLVSVQLGQAEPTRCEIPLAQVGPGNPASWAGYIAGTVWAGLESGAIAECAGLDIAVVSDVPVGSGLSSSAALECSVAVAAYELAAGRQPDDAARKELAQACIRAENEVVGASTGGLDQNASLLCARGKALVLDFATGAVERVPFDIQARDLVLLIADTNAPHTLSDGQYASRRGLIDDVQHALAPGDNGTIRDIQAATGDAVAAARSWAADNAAGDQALDPDLVARRVAHVVEETQRSLEAARALQDGDFDTFRVLMRDSHVSLRDKYEVTTQELDQAFSAAGEVGARMTGGGFGGAVIALIPRDEVDATAHAIAAAAADAGFPEPSFLLAEPGAGARRLR